MCQHDLSSEKWGGVGGWNYWPLSGHCSLELCLSETAQALRGDPRKSLDPQNLWPKGQVGGAGRPDTQTLQGAGWGVVSLASPSPSHAPHTNPLAKPRTDANRQGSLPPAKRAGPSCFNQQSPERLSSLLLRMCPGRPAWDLESHRARPTHRPLLLSVQWKPRARDSWTLVSGQGATKTAPCCWLRTTGTGGPGTSCEHHCAPAQGWLHGGTSTQGERTRQSEDTGHRPGGKAPCHRKQGAKGQLVNSKCPAGHSGQRGSPASTTSYLRSAPVGSRGAE